jgi:WD40 repeat protein
MEPFTSLHVWLQDGKFDHTDRLFNSIFSTWHGSTSNHNDVKELIPEFFYLPEFLENLNDFDLGTAQNGIRLGHVQLPPWSKGSAYEFIRINRDALESEYVSANLHHWIDLIFGYKQRPEMFGGHKAAVDACNVYFHVTYADAINLEAMKKNDKVLYDRTVRQIDNYGQTPCRLFTAPHPPRLSLNKARGLIWPIASIVYGVDTLPLGPEADSQRPELPKRIVCYRAEKISASPILLIHEVRGIKKLITVDSSRIIGLHGFSVRPPDVVPPYSMKPDHSALRVSMGQNASGGWLSSTLSNLTPVVATTSREYTVGVPFSAFDISKHRKMGGGLGGVDTFKANFHIIGTEDNKKRMLERENEREAKARMLAGAGERLLIASPVGPANMSGRSVSPSPYASSHGAHQDHLIADTRDNSNHNSARDSSSRGGNKPRSGSGVNFVAKRPTVAGSADASESSGVVTPEVSPSKPPAGAQSASKHASMGGGSDASRRVRVDEHLSAQLFAALPDSRIIFSCGHWDHSFKATLADNGKLLQSVLVHSEVVTCIDLASDYGQHWLVSGSKDCTVMVWEVNPDRAAPVSWNPLHVLYGHDDTVTCLAVNAVMDIVASGSDDGTVILSALREGQYLRTLAVNAVPPSWVSHWSGVSPITSVNRGKAVFNPSFASYKNMLNFDAQFCNNANPVTDSMTYSNNNLNNANSQASIAGVVSSSLSICMICLSHEGNVIVYTSDNTHHSLFTFTVNGRLLERIHLNERLLTMIVSEDGKVLVTGGERCLVVMRWVHNLQLANDGPRLGQEAVLDGKEGDQPPFLSPIRSLYFTVKERHLIVGLESGEIRVLAQVCCLF